MLLDVVNIFYKHLRQLYLINKSTFTGNYQVLPFHFQDQRILSHKCDYNLL